MRGTLEWGPDSQPKPTAATVTVLSNDQPAASKNRALREFSTAVDNANIAYNPFTSNSNAFAFQALEATGIARSAQPVWAPGWDYRLPVDVAR